VVKTRQAAGSVPRLPQDLLSLIKARPGTYRRNIENRIRAGNTALP
jgi:hypothetical protein